MNDVIQTNILTVALDEQISLPPDVQVIEMASFRSALALLRMSSVQWVITGMKTLDMSVWEFVRQMRRISPEQRWILADSHLDDAMELSARMLGVTGVFESPVELEHLLLPCTQPPALLKQPAKAALNR